MSALLPCPFCGGEMARCRAPYNDIYCEHPDNGCALSNASLHAAYRITAWNTRAGTRTPAPNAPLSGVRDALKGMVETEIELQGDTDSTRFWAAQLATLEAHLAAPQGAAELEAARRVYREYGMKDTTIDAGNLYWALGVALGAPRFTPEEAEALRAGEIMLMEADNKMGQSHQTSFAYHAARLRALLQEGTGG